MGTNDKQWVSDEALEALLKVSHDIQEVIQQGQEQGQQQQPDPPSTSTTVRKTKYPWDIWLDGKLHTAIHGKDFSSPLSTFQITLSNTARRKGLFIRTAVQSDRISVVLQAFKTKEEAVAAWAEEYDDGYGDIEPELD